VPASKGLEVESLKVTRPSTFRSLTFHPPLSAFRDPKSSPIFTAMNRKHTYVSTVLWALLMLGAFAQAQEETTAEPLELTRLREQFQTRVDQEMIPWRDKYKKELQKLEDRLVQERRLSEALAVKKERESNQALNTDNRGDQPVASVSVKSTAELKKFLKGKAWLVYASEDKSREKIIDVYRFINEDEVYCLTAGRNFKFVIASVNSISIAATAGEIALELDAVKGRASADQGGKKYQFLLANCP